MIENPLLGSWLEKKSQEILSKIDKEKFTTEDMLILALKAQTNRFKHMHIEFREEFKKIDQRFERLDHRFDKFDERFESIDQKFDRLYTTIIWGFGLVLTSMIAVLSILLK